MTTTFPPKPWEEGATFTNETTGVGYTYSGGKWLASGGPKVEGEYLPLTGGQVNGELKVAADGNAFSIVKKNGGNLLSSFTGSYSDDIQYWKQPADYGNSKLEIVNGFKLDEELDSYMPLAGDSTKTGKINLVANSGAQLTVNKGSNVNNAITTAQVMSDGTFETVKTSFNDTHLVTKKYVDQAIKDALADTPAAPNPLRKLRFARDKDWNNIRPGEFGLMNDSNGYVGKWSEARQIYFLNVDSDGNRLMRNENAQDFNSYLGSAFTAVTSSGERPVLRVAPTGQAGGWVKLDYGKDLDLIYIAWTDKNCGALMTGTNDNLSNGQHFLFNLPDLFF